MKSEAKVNLPPRAAISISILLPQVDRFHLLSVHQGEIWDRNCDSASMKEEKLASERFLTV